MPGSPRTTNAGAQANATAYGSGDRTDDLNHALYAHPKATPTRCTIPATQPERNDSGTAAAAASRAAVRTARTETSPAATGLSVRPARASRPASSQSLLHPIESCPARIASATASTPPKERPVLTASAVNTAVTVTVGSGWQLRNRAVTSP